MNQNRLAQNPADCSPVFSVAGVMPGGSNMAWKTAFPNPDAPYTAVRRGSGGPSLSIAGVTQGGSVANWRTAMPDPTRDAIDGHGHVVTKLEAATRAELSHRHGILTLAPAGTG